MIFDTECVHWWIIGDYSIGHCKKCGATKDFEKLRAKEKSRMTAARRGKTGSAAVNAAKL